MDTEHADIFNNDKTKAWLLRSWLKQWNLLEKGVVILFYGKRQSDIAVYYSMDGVLWYCNNIKH
jgi:DNA gyrase/topoisomerase IV subunit B